MTGGPDAVLVMGEALIDLVPAPPGPDAEDAADLLRAQPGGAPSNVAVALARLGTPVSFAGGLGADGFARTIEARLEAAGVGLALTARSTHPTALAVADPGAHGTGYHFHLQDTATFELPERTAEVSRFAAVYVGGLAAVVAPAADAVAATARAAAESSLLVVDPNVRQDRTLGPDHGHARLRELCDLAHVVKASDEDLARLWPDAEPEATCRSLAAGGRLVVLTRGAAGSTAYPPTGPPVSVPAVPVDVVNTIGAGDAFTAAVLSALITSGAHRVGAAPALSQEQVRETLAFAAGVAASVCGRAGTEPSVPRSARS
ncbi:PfkB family carbohydrate kinase [Streptomyces candidus]|uniref:Fructokinase n=1 Tax=Streptomyces candidus TaxID=67283 RepID=A0A7X0LTV2_9ACTN|nr:PfkB family carbohydrate kinase [Streptomyces candidus]MBB6439784.1 fructokinase [Streptomyces candidus]GHH56933.1 fructokinase [Streptomyces candidus]